MFLRKRAQSTAEYAITLGLVLALTAGVLQVILKSGVSAKQRKAMDLLLSAGQTVGEFQTPPEGAPGPQALYTQEQSDTTIDFDSFRDTKVTQRGGSQKSLQHQESVSNSVQVEMMNKAD